MVKNLHPERLDGQVQSGYQENSGGVEGKLLGTIFYAAVVLAIVILVAPGRSLQQWAHIAEISSSLLVAVVGGLAALWWFFRRDTLRPRINISHDVELIGNVEVEEKGKKIKQRLLAVMARFHNVGGMPVFIDQWSLAVFRLMPCPAELVTTLNSSHGWVCVAQQVKWASTTAGREMKVDHVLGSWVRSGEIQAMLGFAAIDMDIEVVMVKTDIPHHGLRLFGAERSWSLTTIKKIKEDCMPEGERDGRGFSWERPERPSGEVELPYQPPPLPEKKDLPYSPPPPPNKENSDGP